VDQSPQGLEVLQGAMNRLYQVNWKLQGGSRADAWVSQTGHLHCFENAHLMLSPDCPGLPDRRPRSLCVYPNLLLTDQHIAHYRPVTVNHTEVTIHCIAPRGESIPVRVWRIRQYEEFCKLMRMAPEQKRHAFAVQHRYWQEAMRRALAAERRL